MSNNTKDTPIETVRISYKQEECSKALRGLYNTVDETIAGDVDNKVSAYVYELKTRIKFLEELLNEDLHEENESLKLELQKLNDYISASEQFNATQSQSYRDTISKMKLDLQKQKELNAELVNALKDITKAMSFRGGFPHTTNVFESLIKKSSEI